MVDVPPAAKAENAGEKEEEEVPEQSERMAECAVVTEEVRMSSFAQEVASKNGASPPRRKRTSTLSSLLVAADNDAILEQM